MKEKKKKTNKEMLGKSIKREQKILPKTWSEE